MTARGDLIVRQQQGVGAGAVENVARHARAIGGTHFIQRQGHVLLAQGEDVAVDGDLLAGRFDGHGAGIGRLGGDDVAVDGGGGVGKGGVRKQVHAVDVARDDVAVQGRALVPKALPMPPGASSVP